MCGRFVDVGRFVPDAAAAAAALASREPDAHGRRALRGVRAPTALIVAELWRARPFLFPGWRPPRELGEEPPG